MTKLLYHPLSRARARARARARIPPPKAGRGLGLGRGPDANIDHRRVPNLMKFFERRGKALGLNAAYEPGDVVAWRLPNGLYHVGVVSASHGARDYLVVHNIGYGAKNEDVLRAWTIIGHYRW